MNVNLIRPAHFVQLLDALLAVTLEQNEKLQRSDAYVFVVMAAIPWVAGTLRDRCFTELERLHAGFENYMILRDQNRASSGLDLTVQALAIYRDCGESLPYPNQDRLELLWKQIQQLQLVNWEVQILARPYMQYSAMLVNEIFHEIPAITIPSSLTQVKFNYQPCFWIFDDSLTAGAVCFTYIGSYRKFAKYAAHCSLYSF